MSGWKALKFTIETRFPGSEEINEEDIAPKSSHLFCQGNRECVLV
jgi:hypothetical protein